MNSREKFFDLSVDMLCVANFEGYFVDVNRAFTRVLGYSREELLSKPYLHFVHPDDVNATTEEHSLVEVGSQTLQFENRYRHKEGHYLTLSWSSITDQDEGMVYGIARDVSAQVNLRNRLLQIEQALEKDALVVITDAEGVIASANDKVCERFGYRKDEVTGQHWRSFVGEHRSPREVSELASELAQLKVCSRTVEGDTKSGEKLSIRLQITPIFDHEGAVNSFMAVGHDITESVKNATDLARTIGILNETNSIAKVGGWELDVATGELEWTDETFRILEVEKKVGRKPMLPEGLLLFTPECQPIIERAVSRAIEFGEPYSLELEAQTAKGNVLWVYTNGKANYEDGKVVTLSGTIQDIQARKTAELLYEEEHRRVVRQAKMASLGELSAAMAHELNNPLGIVSAAAEFALEHPDVPLSARDSLEDIMKSCERMAHIVRNLKRFSRTDEEQQAHETHRLRVLIEEALFLVGPRLKRELVRISLRTDTEAQLSCSAFEIEQVLVNLLNNAIDAVKELPERWVRIEIVEEAQHLQVLVTDSGNGIEQADPEELFAPFRTTKAAGEGTGLGLAISRQIVEEHGGMLAYVSGTKNTCFKMTLPRPAEQSHAS